MILGLKNLFLSKTFLLIASYLLTATILELLLFYFLYYSVFPTYIILNMSILLAFAGIIYVLPNKWSKLLFIVFLLFIQVLLNIANVTINKGNNEIFFLNQLSHTEEAKTVFDWSYLNWPANIAFVVFFIAEIAFSIFVCKFKRFNNQSFKTKQSLALFLSVFILMSFGGASILLNARKIYFGKETSNVFDSKSNYHTLYFKDKALQSFGTFGFYEKDIENYLMKKNKSKFSDFEVANFLKSSTACDIEFSGISNGNNIVTILMESLEYFAIDPVFTPTLYRLLTTDGLLLNNYYSNNRSNIAENCMIIGNFSDTHSLSSNEPNTIDAIQNKSLVFNVTELLKNEGYYSSYFSLTDASCFLIDPTYTSKGVGFETFFCGDMMTELPSYSKNDVTNWDLHHDVEVVEKYVLDSFTPEKKFYTQFATMSTHGLYKEKPPLVSYYQTLKQDDSKYDQLWDYLSEKGYTKPSSSSVLSSFNWYKAAAMNLDEAIKMIFDDLCEKNLLDKTTILMYADHNTYMQDLSYHMNNPNFSNGDEVNKSYYYHIQCMIYDENLTDAYVTKYGTREISTFCTPTTLGTTLLGLIDIDYNNNIYLDTSIFDKNREPTVCLSYLSSGMIFNDKFSMVAGSIVWRSNTATDEDLNMFKTATHRVLYLQKIINHCYERPIVFSIYSQL